MVCCRSSLYIYIYTVWAAEVNTGTRTEQNVKAVLTISGKHQEMTLQFVASRDLKPGEELILSYFTGLDNEDGQKK